VRVLTPLMPADMAYVLGEWLRTPLLNNFDGKVYPPGAPSHPASRVLSQDTYLFYLIYRALPNVSVVHVSVPICEYNSARSTEERLLSATVYHHLKSAKHFKWFTPSRWERLLTSNRTRLFCGARNDSLAGQPVHNDSLGHMMERHFGCCRNWKMCMMVQPGQWRGRRPPRKDWFWFLDPRGGRLY